MADQDTNFERESTPIAKAINPPQETAMPAMESQEANWDDDRTEVLINSNPPKKSPPALISMAGEIHPLKHFPYSIGRNKSCDFKPNGRGISRQHAEISMESGRLIIKDLDSENGVKVNGHNVSQILLEDQDKICIGDCDFTFVQSSAKKAPINFEKEASHLGTHEKKWRWSKATFYKLCAALILAIGLIQASNYLYRSNERTLIVPTTVAPDAPISLAHKADRPEQEESKQASPSAQSKSDKHETRFSKEVDLDKEPETELVETEPQTSEKTSTLATNSTLETFNPDSKASKATEETTQETPSAPKKANPRYQDISSSLNSAKRHYQSGKVKYALYELKVLAGKKNITPTSRIKARSLYSKIETLHAIYEQGDVALMRQQEEQAIVLWEDYLNRAKEIWPQQDSPYQEKAQQFLVEKYVTRAENAENNKQYKESYRLWQKLYNMNRSPRAEEAIDNLNVAVQDIYRNALRQEYINTEKSLRYWREIQTLVPPENEYYKKAQLKLDLHN